MVHHDFWVLLGSVTVTLTAVAFVALEIFYKRARRSLDELRRYGLIKLITSVSFTRIINNVIYFLIPMMLSLLFTGNKDIWLVRTILICFLILLCFSAVSFIKLFIYYIQYYKYEKIKLCKVLVASLSHAIPLLMLLFVITRFQFFIFSNTAVSLKPLAIISLALGLLFTIPTLNSFAIFEAVFETTKTAKGLAKQRLDKISKRLESLRNCFNNFQAGADRDEKVDSLQELFENYESLRCELENKLAQEQVTYSAIRKHYNEVEIIEAQIEMFEQAA